MKKYFSFFLAVAGCAVFTSCEDSLLDPFTPGTQTADVAIDDSSDLVALMNTAYSSITPAAEIDFNAVFTDEVAKGYASGGQGSTDLLPQLLNSSTGSANAIWTTYYVAIAYCNQTIKYSENITATDDQDQVVINRALAEARTLRAFAHNQLISYYSTNPKDAGALGVLLSNDVYPYDYVAPRVTNGELYTFIDSDLQTALTLFPASDPLTPTRANKNFAKAVMARSLALRGDYANALIAADDVIATSGVNMATFAQYNSIWRTDTNAANVEVIFKLDKLADETAIGGLFASTSPTVLGSPFYEVGRGLYNVLNNAIQPTSTQYTITAVSGITLTIPGNTLSVNDMIVAQESRPLDAVASNSGTATSPTNSLLAGKVYWVRSVSGNNVTLTADANTTQPVNFTGAVATFTPVNIWANSGDIRYSAVVHPSSIINYNYATSGNNYLSSDKIVVGKYPGTASTAVFINDVKISRITEMYLIRAEAQIAAGELGNAATTIKQIRDVRFNKPQPLPVYADAAEAWRDVLRERRKEFALEGYRYVDLKRLGALAGVGVDRDPKDCQEANDANCSLPVTDYRFTLPIPEVESNANPLVRSQQNPGY